MTIEHIRQKVGHHAAAYAASRLRVKQEKRELETANARVVSARVALRMAQEVARAVQEKAHHQIADVVTQSLAAVFDEPYTFRIVFEQKRNRTEASLVFERGGQLVDPMTAAGGGVVDVAAFALRLSCLLLSRPPLRRLLVLDEPFRFVSAEYRPRVRKLVEALASDFGVQFLMVTHMPELECGKVIRL